MLVHIAMPLMTYMRRSNKCPDLQTIASPMEGDQTKMCTVVAMDDTSFCYRVCSACDKTVGDSNICKFCESKALNPHPKRVFRILMSVATQDKVFVVICFDRAARVLFGCSADEFYDFVKLNPFAVATAGKVLEGEMLQMTLSNPKNGNAEHLRAVAIIPLRSGFCPVIETLKELYGATR